MIQYNFSKGDPNDKNDTVGKNDRQKITQIKTRQLDG